MFAVRKSNGVLTHLGSVVTEICSADEDVGSRIGKENGHIYAEKLQYLHVCEHNIFTANANQSSFVLV
jgi:hypothetical protein